jgi:ATP-dependent Lon protease
MEVIRLSGYTEDEKVNIAKRYLLPKQMKNNGLKDGELKVVRGRAARHRPLLHARGRRAQPRARDREDLPQGREAAAAAEEGPEDRHGHAEDARQVPRRARFRYGKAEEENQVGQVTGLAWTEVGGELLTIEAATVPGKGKLQHTGKLGEVMQESIQAAMTVVRSRVPRARHRPGFLPEERHPHPRAGGRDARRTARAPASACARRWCRC